MVNQSNLEWPIYIFHNFYKLDSSSSFCIMLKFKVLVLRFSSDIISCLYEVVFLLNVGLLCTCIHLFIFCSFWEATWSAKLQNTDGGICSPLHRHAFCSVVPWYLSLIFYSDWRSPFLSFTDLSRKILRGIALALGSSADAFEGEIAGDAFWVLRIIGYPGASNEKCEDLAQNDIGW